MSAGQELRLLKPAAGAASQSNVTSASDTTDSSAPSAQTVHAPGFLPLRPETENSIAFPVFSSVVTADITPIQRFQTASRAATALNFACSSVVTVATAPIQHVQPAPPAAAALEYTPSSIHTVDIAPVQHVETVPQAATALDSASSSVVTAGSAPIRHVQTVPRAATALNFTFSTVCTAATVPVEPTPSDTVHIPRAAFAAHATQLRRVFEIFEGM
ncbi:hypothetical protein KCU81_g5415, partial [Aureobasidium melanogenum]|uniref:Uncharacterized protein n=1 Tax=Aureobasidium melanogenum (strain CBS 110374) TaxID=1043003 RepID=A0A074W6Y8_AURM1